MTQEEIVKLKLEVNDLLNQITIKLASVPEVQMGSDYDSGRPSYELDENGNEKENIESKEHIQLDAIKNLVKILLSDSNYDGPAALLEKYYDSTCY